ncbi:phosphohydrolase [Candidatus Saccharibacteria bacterium]|nr:phosphohydrolase [Candidatus Saccharibacteria bacterium]
MSSEAETLLQGLKQRYAEPWRYYHTGLHISELLGTIRNYQSYVHNPRVVVWSMLYHDAIYDPTAMAGRNEELSAQLAEHESPILLSPEETERVATYIRATASHQADEVDSDPDLAFFLDSDLLILGAEPTRYDKYARDVRQEYIHVSDHDYRVGRARILGALAGASPAGNVFTTKLFRDLYEAQAQTNIAREIKQLTS